MKKSFHLIQGGSFLSQYNKLKFMHILNLDFKIINKAENAVVKNVILRYNIVIQHLKGKTGSYYKINE